METTGCPQLGLTDLLGGICLSSVVLMFISETTRFSVNESLKRGVAEYLFSGIESVLQFNNRLLVNCLFCFVVLVQCIGCKMAADSNGETHQRDDMARDVVSAVAGDVDEHARQRNDNPAPSSDVFQRFQRLFSHDLDTSLITFVALLSVVLVLCREFGSWWAKWLIRKEQEIDEADRSVRNRIDITHR